jgi:predicted RNase H-like HicB family nuclease
VNTDEQTIDFGEISPEQLEEASHYSVEIHWSPEDSAYLASVPELDGVITHGSTPTEAVVMANEAAALWLSVARYYGRAIPAPRLAFAS